MPESHPLRDLLKRPDFLGPVALTRLWRVTARYLLRPGEFARPRETPEFEALALPLPSHRLASAPPSRGAIPLRMEPAYLAGDEATARAEFFARWPATRYKVWSWEASFAACLDVTDPVVFAELEKAGVHLTEDRASWAPLFAAAWPLDVEAIRFRSFVAREQGGLNYAVLRLRPGAQFGEPRLESDSM